VFLASLVANLLVANNAVPARTVADVIALGKASSVGLDFASSRQWHAAASVPGNVPPCHRHQDQSYSLSGRRPRAQRPDWRPGEILLLECRLFNGSCANRSNPRHRPYRPRPARAPARSARRGRYFPGFEAYEWNGVFAPNGTPIEIIRKLNFGLNASIAQPDVQQRLKALSVEVRENTAEEFRSFVASEMDKWQRVVREANVKLG
jgi:hypothetical protein